MIVIVSIFLFLSGIGAFWVSWGAHKRASVLEKLRPPGRSSSFNEEDYNIKMYVFGIIGWVLILISFCIHI